MNNNFILFNVSIFCINFYFYKFNYFLYLNNLNSKYNTNCNYINFNYSLYNRNIQYTYNLKLYKYNYLYPVSYIEGNLISYNLILLYDVINYICRNLTDRTYYFLSIGNLLIFNFNVCDYVFINFFKKYSYISSLLSIYIYKIYRVYYFLICFNYVFTSKYILNFDFYCYSNYSYFNTTINSTLDDCINDY